MRRERALSNRNSRSVWAAATAILLPLAPIAFGQATVETDAERRQIFESYDAFKDQLTAVASIADVDERETQVRTLWKQLSDAGQIPFAQGTRAAFLFRGEAKSVAVAGDFNKWDPRDAIWQAKQVGGADVWILETELPADARVDYKFVVDGKDWKTDPANPHTMWSPLGGANSELRMPAYQPPPEIVRRPDIPRGQLSDVATIASAKLGYDVNHRVYTPAGYDAGGAARYPVVYVTDGLEYASDVMGRMPIVLDNLIADKTLRPVIAVFIDPSDPATGNNRRMSEYGENETFSAFVAEEVVPRIDKTYRTTAEAAGRTILGTSLGALAAATLGATRPDMFGNVALQSPADFAKFAPATLKKYDAPELASKLHVAVVSGTIGDGNAGPMLANALKRHGFKFKSLEVNEGHSWGSWRGSLDEVLIELVGAPRE
jgi:enterochelin esterase family protein